MPMHDSTRDQLLDIMAAQGWANCSDGDVESPVGHFARISNETADINSLVDAFGDEAFDIDPDFDFSEMVGHFLVSKDSQGFLSVWTFCTESQLIAAYVERENIFSNWLMQDDNE